MSIIIIEEENKLLPNDSVTLKCYDHSTEQFGHPYNVTRDHEESNEFLECSRNNLNDTHTTSNCGVHSR